MATTERSEHMNTTETNDPGSAIVLFRTGELVPSDEATTPEPKRSRQWQSDDLGDKRLEGIIRRIEALEAEKSEISASISEALNDAKLFGYDTKALRLVLKLRKLGDCDTIDIANLYMCRLRMHEQLELPFNQPSQREVA